MLIVQLPIAADLFGTVPLSPLQWAVCVGAAASVLGVEELAKPARRRPDRARS